VRALVIDDVPINVQVQQEFMKGWGMRVESASSGEQGIAMMRDAARDGDPVRVALVDFLMPGMDGEMFARAARADDAIAGAVLVLATSAAQRGDADRFHAAGFNAYLTKPFRPETLASALESVLARGPGWRQDDPIVTRHSIAERRRSPTAPPPEKRAVPGVARPAFARVLVAEDNPVNQMVAGKMLERLGCRVDIAADGSEAVAMAERFQYDVIFMDIQMPVTDGLEATRSFARAPAEGTCESWR
jgi:CheY-like chemotaxis protein